MLLNKVAIYRKLRKYTRLILYRSIYYYLISEYLISLIGLIIYINPYKLYITESTFINILNLSDAKNIEK